jgi:hypothetical protein
MAIHVQWDDPAQTTICFVVDGAWTWDEFYQAKTEANTLMDAVPQIHIHCLVDMHRGNMLPRNAITHFSKLQRSSHTKMGHVVLIGTNGFVQAIFRLMDKISVGGMSRIHLAPTYDDARDLLAKVDSNTASVR